MDFMTDRVDKMVKEAGAGIGYLELGKQWFADQTGFQTGEYENWMQSPATKTFQP